jgi:hypothetical protein
MRSSDVSAETPDLAQGPWLEAVLHRCGELVGAAHVLHARTRRSAGGLWGVGPR